MSEAPKIQSIQSVADITNRISDDALAMQSTINVYRL